MILHQCALTDAGKTWITDINVKSQEKVHLMMDPPRICIWGPPNNSIKYQTNLPLNQPGWSTRCAKYLLCAAASAALIADGPCSQGENAGFTKDITFLGSSWDEKAKKCFQIPCFWVKKLKLANTRKLSKTLLFMDIAELFQGPQVSGSAKFHLPGIGEPKKRPGI